MEIAIFNDLTTEEKLQELEADGIKYQGLYVDMEDKEQRKYVKDKAKLIGDILKKIERARIDKTSVEKLKIDSEAKSLTDRLKVANEPYSLLISDYTKNRAKVLADEKARKKSIEDAVKLEGDHEFALLLNMQHDSDKDRREAQAKSDEAQRVIDQTAHDKKIADDAAEHAKQVELSRQAYETDKLKRENEQRAQNLKITGDTHRAILKVLVRNGLTEDQGKIAIRLMAKGGLPKVVIHY